MKPLLVTLALVLAALSAPAAAAPLSPEQFRDRMVADWQARFGTVPTLVSPTSFDAKQPDGTNVRVNIDNAYHQYLAKPEDIDTLIAGYLQALVTSGTDNVSTLEQLVVIVRPTDYLTASAVPGADLSKFLPTRHLGGDLSLFLAVDSPTTLRTASTDDLARWRIDLATAWQRAAVNLKARMGQLGMGRMGDDAGASAISAESGLAPSLLATPAFCGAAAPQGFGGQVVLVVARDAFMFGVPSDPETMTRFWRDARAAISSDSSLSRTPLTCRNGRWESVPLP